MPAPTSRSVLLASAVLVLGGVLPSLALAQAVHQHGMHQSAPSPSTAAFQAANAKMHKDMDIAYSGDADVDFVHGMIAHHQGAIDMAKVELSYGKDPQIRKLAEDVIAAQEKEISDMRAWLAARGK
ncbi:DUF305 domain-containing protein [Aquabacter sp. CN5-332]|uniref:CopM family metallochaperone n=1 Tax=Aquabacter sp. CN5-332 TaxID=3156608 RepID=UPI0032B4FB5E